MTDRIGSFTVVLEHDIREDDVEHIQRALQMVRGVLSVEAHVSDIEQHIAEERARHDLGQKILMTVRDLVYPNAG